MSDGDQVDKAGRPYIVHLDRVVAILKGLDQLDWDLRDIAYLHDVMEDTKVTRQQIYAEFGDYIAEGVETLTRQSDEPYTGFVRRVARSPYRVIKLADVLEHLAVRSDGYELPPSLLRRYQRALSILLFPDPPRT